MLCRLLAEMDAHVGDMSSVLAVHQEFSIEGASNHEAIRHIGSMPETVRPIIRS